MDPIQFSALIDQSLSAQLYGCGCTTIVQPHSTGWRTMPWMVCAEVVGGADLIEREGEPPLTMEIGDCLCVLAHIRHRFTLATPTPAVSRWAHAQFTVFGAIDVLAVVQPPVVIRGAAARAIGDACAALTAVAGAETLAAAATRRRHLAQLLEVLISVSDRPDHRLSALQEVSRLAPVLSLVEARLADPELSIAALAAAGNLSPSRFHAVFRAAIGMAPVRYLQSRRMARAEQLLVGSDLRIREVAARAGFGDEFHFSRLFKRLHGISPLGWRAQALAARVAG